MEPDSKLKPAHGIGEIGMCFGQLVRIVFVRPLNVPHGKDYFVERVENPTDPFNRGSIHEKDFSRVDEFQIAKHVIQKRQKIA